MGASTSKRRQRNLVNERHQGNLLLEGFLRYAQGEDQPWTKVKCNPRVHMEVLLSDKPLGTWRGTVSLEGVKMEEVQSYIHFKLGMDKYELLAVNEDDEWVFRDVFDFSSPLDEQRNSRSTVNVLQTPATSRIAMHVGDHRGEDYELMDEPAADDEEEEHTENARRTSQRDSIDTEFDDDEGDDEEPASAGGNEEDNTDEVTVDDNAARVRTRSTTSEASTLSKRPSSTPTTTATTWWGIKFPKQRQGSKLRASQSNMQQRMSAQRHTGNGYRPEPLPLTEPLPRELVFKRQVFMLENAQHEQTTAVTIAQSCKWATPPPPNATRATMSMMGTLVESPSSVFKTNQCKLTYVCSMDPQLSDWEVDLVSNSGLSQFGGKHRVERFLLDAVDFFRHKPNRLMLKFRQSASAGLGEMGWTEVERSKNELQLGTNVLHPKHGHGVVQSFDMKGRVRVVYDSKEVVDHLPEEKDELKVSVLIGTRVKHHEKGLGTVKAFDESGRVHVKFDNGDFHRYKQAAWKKKMHLVKMVGIGGALGTVKLAQRPFDNVREGIGRVKFAVGVSTEAVLEHILEMNSTSSADELKGGSILERRIVERVSEHEVVIYEHRRMPPPLTPRDFVMRLYWDQVAPKTYVVVMESIRRSDLPERAKTVRGETHLTGWLLEPLYLDRVSADGEDHICRVTYQLCMDTRGFVAPEAVESVRLALLLAAVTDTRAYFWEQSQTKSKHAISKQQDIIDRALNKKEKASKLAKSTRPSLESGSTTIGVEDPNLRLSQGNKRAVTARTSQGSFTVFMKKLSDLSGGGSQRKKHSNLAAEDEPQPTQQHAASDVKLAAYMQ